VFIEYDPTAYFTGGRRATVSSITATIREGFDDAVRSELLTRLCDSWSSITGQDRRRVTVSLDEVDTSSRMEGGMILPSFGDEAIWARAHAHELAEFGWRD
jgi:phenylpyruvate tautomerase PptA (4-oxalocrotonate tautomerase family)